MALLEDLSSRATAMTSRLDAERARQTILDTATDAFISIDSSSRVLDWNLAATALFGYAAAEAIGRDLATLIMPTDLAESHRHGVAHVAAGGSPSIIGRTTEVAARHRRFGPAHRADCVGHAFGFGRDHISCLLSRHRRTSDDKTGHGRSEPTAS